LPLISRVMVRFRANGSHTSCRADARPCALNQRVSLAKVSVIQAGFASEGGWARLTLAVRRPHNIGGHVPSWLLGHSWGLHMKINALVALSHALSGAAALIASVATKGQIDIPAQPVKAIGYAVFALGCLLFAYSLLFLRRAFAGNIDPVSEDLVTGGPYRVVRHPLYLAMLVICLGLAVGLRSWLGIAFTIIVFFPSAVYRARLEEVALEDKFGAAWKAYRDRTRFIVPFFF